jgi:hypothetical protein
MAIDYLLMGWSKHHNGWMDGWMDRWMWVGMKHFSVGFQFPGCIVVAMVVSSVAVHTSVGRVLLTHFGFQAGSQFDSETEDQRFSLWARIDTLKTDQVSREA